MTPRFYKMDTLKYILNKFEIILDNKTRMPIEIPNFGRAGLATLFHELGFKVGAEIGVLEGTYSEILCQNNPGVKLYAIDPWKRHRGYRDYVRNSTFSNAHEKAQKTLAQYNCEILRMFSMDAVKQFDDESLDFVYIDGNHDFENVTNDVSAWLEKIKVGGVIAGHDYVKHKGPSKIHVYEAINGFTKAYKIRPWFILGSNAIIPGEIRDDSRSFLWVKQ